MAFDGIVIANIVHELSDKLENGRFTKINQPEPDELVITAKSPKGVFKILLSASASLPLIYLTEQSFVNPLTAPNFCMLLRKHIGNARILSISQNGLERTVDFLLEHLDEMGDVCQKHLIIEIMGKHSNLIFCSRDYTIIDSIKHISAAVSSVREVLPGRPYFIPDTTGKRNPLLATRETFFLPCDDSLNPAAFLSKFYTGISSVSAEEIVFRSGLDSSRTVNSFSEEEQNQFWIAFSSVMDIIRSGSFLPCIAYRGEEPAEFSAFDLTGHTECRLEYEDSISRVLETYYAEKNQFTRIRQKSVQLRKVVQNALERSNKKYDLQMKQMKDTEKREKYRIYGELLNTYGYQCEPGAKSVTVMNYYTSEDLTIPLDPTLTALENAQKYFERYNKLKRTYEALTSQLRETESEIYHLDSVNTSLEMAQSATDLDEIKKELVSCGYIRAVYGKKNKKDTRIKSVPYHYRSSDGFDIYVGKNNLQNEELTFKFADGNDIWMHAKKIPGSHVIIKTGGKEVPDRTYEEAGCLAAFYSKGRDSDKVEIDYIERKFVKKPAGAKPGFVIYHTNYSLVASPDISGIQEI